MFGGLRDEISEVDLAFANLEVPLCRDQRAIAKSGPNLQADPACARALAEAGFHVVGLANNHIMDYGSGGLTDTLAACERLGLKTCGAGADARAATAPLILTCNGVRVALIAVAEREFNAAGDGIPGAAILDPIDISRQIVAVRPNVDLVLVTVHGGNEYFPFPRPGLRRLCHYMADIGADAIVCHHPHVPGAYEIYGGKPVIYSLGNLIFDTDPIPPGWREGYAVKLVFQKGEDGTFSCELAFIPYEQSLENGGVRLLEAEEKSTFLRRLETYRDKIADTEAWLAEWAAFCRRQRLSYITAQYIPFRFRGLGPLTRYLQFDRLFLPRSMLDRRRNMLRCESHRELLSTILERE